MRGSPQLPFCGHRQFAVPSPEFEDIARQIKASLEHVGGGQSLNEVYDAKVAAVRLH
jgi:hypothetical protein